MGLEPLWSVSQFSVSTTPFLQCVAVSTTSDATGTYNRYAFQEPNFNDYPKLGVWPDGYYTSFNMFNGNGDQNQDNIVGQRSVTIAGVTTPYNRFLRPTTVIAPRIFRVGVRFSF